MLSMPWRPCHKQVRVAMKTHPVRSAMCFQEVDALGDVPAARESQKAVAQAEDEATRDTFQSRANK